MVSIVALLGGLKFFLWKRSIWKKGYNAHQQKVIKLQKRHKKRATRTIERIGRKDEKRQLKMDELDCENPRSGLSKKCLRQIEDMGLK